MSCFFKYGMFSYKSNSSHKSEKLLIYMVILIGTSFTLYYCYLLEFSRARVANSLFSYTNSCTIIKYLSLSTIGIGAGYPGVFKSLDAEIIVDSFNIRKSKMNIFFIETSCATHLNQKSRNLDKIILTERGVCSVESSLRMNPNHSVYLLYTCPLDRSILDNSPSYVKQLSLYSNFKFVKLNVSEYFENSLVEHLVKDRILDASLYPLEHSSDVLRFLTLWKYGGTYMDLDVLNLRPLIELGSNYAGFESRYAIGSAVLNFEFSGAGNQILTKILVYLNSTFNGNGWGNNGPDLVTKMLLELCDDASVRKQKQVCKDFTIYNTEYFYPIRWQDWDLFFSREVDHSISQRLNNSYCVHLWNKHSSKKDVVLNSTQIYEILSASVCPLAHSKFGSSY